MRSRIMTLKSPMCDCGRRHIYKGAAQCSLCREEAGYYNRFPRLPSVPSSCAICDELTQYDICRKCAGILSRDRKRGRLAQRLREKGMTLAEIGQLMGGISRQRVDQLLHGNQNRARQKVAWALSTGRIQRPTACERCKAQTDELQAHHYDYNKPLDVTWLCDPCHNIVHPHHPKIRRDGGKP